MGENIIIILFAVAIPLFYVPMLIVSKRRDKRKEIPAADVINMTRDIQTIMLVLAVLFYVVVIIAGPLCALYAPAGVTYSIVSLCGAGAVVSAIGHVYTKSAYFVIKEDSFTFVSFLTKDKTVLFDKVKCYRNFLLYGQGGVQMYGHSGEKLFTSDTGFGNRLYYLVKKLEERGIHEMGVEQNKNLEKQFKIRMGILSATLCGLCFLAVFIAMYVSISPPLPYQNYDVSGTVAEYEFTDENYPQLKIVLEGHEQEYFVTSTALKELDKELKRDISIGDTVKLLIAHDEDGKRKISQIELNDRIYLTADKAEAAEIQQYKFNRNMMFTFLGIACAFFAGAVALTVYYFHTKSCFLAQYKIQE